MKEDVPLGHAEWRRNLTSRNNIMQKEKSSPSRSNQPSNVPNYVTIATREAPLRALKSYPPQLFGSYWTCGRFEGANDRLVGRRPPYAEDWEALCTLRHQLRSN